MKFIILFLSLFAFSSFAEVCVFKGNVHPASKYKEVSSLYKLSCEWFVSHFKSYPDPDIVLTDVYYIDNWDSVKWITNRPPGILYGAFYKAKERDINVIYLELSEKAAYKKTDIIDRSFLFHEFIHYFIKAANFDELKNNNSTDLPIHEAIAYYAQDQFIQMMTEGEKTFFDFFNPMLKDQIIFISVHSFPGFAYRLYTNKPGSFMLNAIEYFKTNPVEKYNMLINGSYTRPYFN